MAKRGMKVMDASGADVAGLVKPPPAVKVPKAPNGFVPTNPADYRGFRPKKAELAAVPDAVRELASFKDYEAVFGKTAPPVDHVTQALDAAGQWTELLVESKDWMAYVKSLEGMAWKDTLSLVDRLKGPFALAGANDPSLLSKYPSLARLLGVAKAAAKKAVATKKRNAKANAGGGGTAGATPAQPTPAAPPAQPAGTAPVTHASGGTQ